MKRTLNDRQLKNITVPTVTLNHHQANLRRALVSYAAQKAETKTILPILQGVKNFMNKRTIFAGTGITGALVLAVVAFSGVTQSPPVSAMELAQNSSKALQSMSLSSAVSLSDKESLGMSEQEVTYKKYFPLFVAWLEAAQKAPDLRMLSYKDVLKAYPEANQANSEKAFKIVDNPQDGQTPDLQKLKYLEFSLVEGDAKSKIVIGVNDQNIPEAALTDIIVPGKARG